MAEGVIPKNWLDFLRVNSNKTEFFNLLSRALLVAFNQTGKQLVITDGDSILSKPPTAPKVKFLCVGLI